MTRQTVLTSDRSYLFSSDGSTVLANRIWALVKVRLIDELTGQAPAGPSAIRTSLRGIFTRVRSDGIGGVVGVPIDVFPGLNAQIYSVPLSIISEGYVNQQFDVTVQKDANFPNTFSPPQLIDVFLHRQPTVIRGRTIRATGGSMTPVPGATVSITGIWRTPPQANSSTLASAPNIVSLRPPLYAGRKPVAGHLRRRNLSSLAGDKFLLDDAPNGAVAIRLSDRVNLSTGNILLIDANEPDLIEFISIASIKGAGTADQPSMLVLNQPLAYEHRSGALVLRVSPQPLGPVRQIAVEALAWDTCVFLNNMGGLGTASEVEMTGGATTEYHSLKRFSVSSDADGYYRLPPLSRVAQVVIQGKKVVGPQTFAAKLEFRPDFSKHENTVDLTLSV
jgi:hypothetical protein